ncbi:molybdopterin-dependent oxidoreductase [Thalassotalea sp. Y01]|uniref:molybdopterin-dependent oxidoreductase n=1 Tax=Thalassotalea sp. Y01 TaxID=2729613 RepID=UPI00145F0EE3|nr:molybdopterin-dependent oxidoreductase [Thalassotalea sp. Y01]NMP14737.1 molybdopterin-dependent oxidoreductase [Thalassotalea sp. Y01]
MANSRVTPTCTHWGNYLVESDGESLLSINHYDVDKEATAIGDSLIDGLDKGARIPQPMIRESYFKDGVDSCGAGRGNEKFVPVSWSVALDLAAQALKHTKQNYGTDAVYGSSYGWASAGRFHHAQSQIHRFLGKYGGYVDSVNTYSSAAAEVIMNHVTGIPFLLLVREAPSPKEIADNSQLFVLFGGAAIKNSQVNAGGIGSHNAVEQLSQLKSAGVKVVNISPIRDDVIEQVDAQWLPIRPNGDVALMLALAHTLYNNNLHDANFLERYTVGFDQFIPYLTGQSDGVPKNAKWASLLTEISEQDIIDLAFELGNKPSTLSISWSLQRQQYGEQTYWMLTTLAAMLGHIGKVGAGVGYGYGCIHNMGFGGRKVPTYKMGALGMEIGERPALGDKKFIPVARHVDMLNNPGQSYQYNGLDLTYPDIKLIYWAGGNPFHHHQDLHALTKAWSKPDTIIVQDAFWTASARHADIVFPVTTMLERNDLGGSSYDAFISPMRQAVKPYAQARSDFEIFSGLAQRLGFADEFTGGKTEMQWVENLYNTTRENAKAKGVELPTFDAFWQGEQFYVGDQLPDIRFTLERFRQDPDKYPLRTPSGKIEIFSSTIANFNYDDCHGHPMWYSEREWLGSEHAKAYPLHLISNQPKTRLHSQFDHGVTSVQHKINGRERARLNRYEADKRGLKDGDIMRLFNDRGQCLAGVEISDELRDGVIELPTGAWYDPKQLGESVLDAHGNPNALTADVGTSRLAQGCSAHSCLVEVEKYCGELPDISVFKQPKKTQPVD